MIPDRQTDRFAPPESVTEREPLPRVPHLVLYDGVCGLCDRFVQHLLRIDHHERLHFAPLQGETAARLEAEGIVPPGLDTVVYVRGLETGAPEAFVRSDAALRILATTGGLGGRLLSIFRVVPRPLRDAVYRGIAATRYRIFGRFESCKIPAPSVRARFLD